MIVHSVQSDRLLNCDARMRDVGHFRMRRNLDETRSLEQQDLMLAEFLVFEFLTLNDDGGKRRM